jgi:nucleoside-diphosphate-sugar epimerase
LLCRLQTRSFQYVDDLIRGMVAVMEGDEIGPFNVGNPGEFTMLELAQVSLQGAWRPARLDWTNHWSAANKLQSASAVQRLLAVVPCEFRR